MRSWIQFHVKILLTNFIITILTELQHFFIHKAIIGFQLPTLTPSFVRWFIAPFCLPWQHWYGKHLQRMSDKCNVGWPRAVFSSLVFTMFGEMIYVAVNNRLPDWFRRNVLCDTSSCGSRDNASHGVVIGKWLAYTAYGVINCQCVLN